MRLSAGSLLFSLILIAAVILEGYYIIELRQSIRESSDELRRISLQLQTLKQERDGLKDELTAVKKHRGDASEELSPQRQP